MNPEWVGYLAAILTTAAYVPQLLRVLKYRHTHSISLGMYCLITCGLAAWTWYGVLIGSPSIIVANIITFVMALIILIMKVKHG